MFNRKRCRLRLLALNPRQLYSATAPLVQRGVEPYRRRFVDVEQDRGIVFPLNSRQLYLPGAASLSKARKYRAGVLPSWGARLAVNFRERSTGELWRTLSRRSLHNTHFGE